MKQLQQKILFWYNKHKRDLPWRKTRNPYHILVSEVMLQQTQVDRVIPYYLRWLKKFPTIEKLARAQPRTVLNYWSGLGYNNRALRLQQTAKTLEGKSFPKTEEELKALPGIGPYTARAILSFAFNKEVPVIDTNIRRILIHELKLKENTLPLELEERAKKLIPKGKSRIWHNALMDYGAIHLTSRKTGIKSLSKQSKFEGSERQARGKILKLLLAQKTISLISLKQKGFHNNIDHIIAKMVKENIIIKEARSIRLR